MEHGTLIGATDNPLVDFDAVCQRVRAAVEPARPYGVSLHDERGEVVWLSESSMGPDEHNAAREAIEKFSVASSLPAVISDLGDSRAAVLLRAVNKRRTLVGAIMVIVDARIVRQDGRSALKVMLPKLQRAAADFAEMRPDRGSPCPAAPAAEAKPRPPIPPMRPPIPPVLMPLGAPGGFTPKQPRFGVRPKIDGLHAALRRSPISLHVQRLVPLTQSGPLKRYEVLLRMKSGVQNAAPRELLKAAVEQGLGSMIDRRVIIELVAFLVRHRALWNSNAAMFSVNLTTTALHDERFIKFVGLCLAKAALPAGVLAFEVDTVTAVKMGGKMAVVAAALHRLGCPLVLDDFEMSTECFALLRLPGVRYVKLSPSITEKMRTDKLSQASITAVVQMARVLGMHTVAKRTETTAEHEWLTALGVDFVQSNSLSPAVAIDSLTRTPGPPKA